MSSLCLDDQILRLLQPQTTWFEAPTQLDRDRPLHINEWTKWDLLGEPVVERPIDAEIPCLTSPLFVMIEQMAGPSRLWAGTTIRESREYKLQTLRVAENMLDSLVDIQVDLSISIYSSRFVYLDIFMCALYH